MLSLRLSGPLKQRPAMTRSLEHGLNSRDESQSVAATANRLIRKLYQAAKPTTYPKYAFAIRRMRTVIISSSPRQHWTRAVFTTATAYTACAVLADSRYDGYLSLSSAGTSIDCEPDETLTEPNYYFHVPGVAQYDLVADFNRSVFPHGKFAPSMVMRQRQDLQSYWSTSANDLGWHRLVELPTVLWARRQPVYFPSQMNFKLWHAPP